MSLLEPRVWDGKIFINDWVHGSGDDITVIEPATNSELGRLGSATPQDVAKAAEEAAKAQKKWASLPPAERSKILRRAGQLWEEHAAEIQTWIIRETGSIPAKAQLETDRAAADCYESAGLATSDHGSVLASNSDRWSFARRRPAGVVSVIAPFNFPLILSIRSVAPALALGNAVLLKPDPRTSVSGGVVLVRIFEEAGLPQGLLQLLPGGGDVGEAVVTAPEVSIVSFTGSTSAGRKVGELGSRYLKRVHLELGGNNALIVLPGADIAKAASAGAFASFMHQGQICMSTGRHIVHASLYEEYVNALAEKAEHLPIGDPAQNPVALGPIIDSKQLLRVHEIVTQSVDAGAKLVAGGTHENLFYKPTVLSDISLTMPAWRDEIFGPVAPVIPFSDVDEAIAIAQASEYGLSLGILGEVGMAMQIADQVSSGIIHINEQTVDDEPYVPFGGVGDSGNGSRFGGSANIDAFSDVQWLTVRPEIASYPF